MDIDAETLRREWSNAILRRWFLPLLAAALAGAVTYPIALHFDPPRARGRTYIYMPHHDVAAFRQAVDALPSDIEKMSDAHGNLFLELTAPNIVEAQDRLVLMRAALEGIATTSLAQTAVPASADAEEWVKKLQSETVLVAEVGGGGEATSVVISWVFMLTVAGILLARSIKYDTDNRRSQLAIGTQP